MEIAIRAYTHTDRQACLEAFKSNVPVYFSEQEVTDFTIFLEGLENGAYIIPYYVITYNQMVMGCGGYERDEKNRTFALAWGLIHNDFHKLGFGEKLLQYRLEQIKEWHKNATVIIDTTQHSAPFFEKYGFVTKKETTDYYAPGMHRIDMELS
jgi:ribosomal-protein-alanine N-acetyltransferase